MLELDIIFNTWTFQWVNKLKISFTNRYLKLSRGLVFFFLFIGIAVNAVTSVSVTSKQENGHRQHNRYHYQYCFPPAYASQGEYYPNSFSISDSLLPLSWSFHNEDTTECLSSQNSMNLSFVWNNFFYLHKNISIK